MALINPNVTQDLVRRAALSLLAGVLGLAAAAFLTTAAWLAISEPYGSMIAAGVIGSTYLLLALLIWFLKPTKLDQPVVSNVDIGLALSSSFVQGFSAAQRVRR